MRCALCSRWGQCNLVLGERIASLLDVDGIGVICIPCYERGWPPQYEYVQRLLQPKMPSHLAATVAAFTCDSIHSIVERIRIVQGAPVESESVRCIVCDPSWTGWYCQHCDRWVVSADASRTGSRRQSRSGAASADRPRRRALVWEKGWQAKRLLQNPRTSTAGASTSKGESRLV